MIVKRVELLRDTLVKGTPFAKGTVISVDQRMYNYLDNALCIKDADEEVEPPHAAVTHTKAHSKSKK